MLAPLGSSRSGISCCERCSIEARLLPGWSLQSSAGPGIHFAVCAVHYSLAPDGRPLGMLGPRRVENLPTDVPREKYSQVVAGCGSCRIDCLDRVQVAGVSLFNTAESIHDNNNKITSENRNFIFDLQYLDVQIEFKYYSLEFSNFKFKILKYYYILPG